MKSKTGQESKYREHLLSDINIYLAIYSLNSYIFEYNLLKPEDRHLYHQLQDKFDERLVSKVTEDVKKRIKQLLDDPDEFIQAKVYFKPKKLVDGKLEFRPLHTTDLITQIAIVSMLHLFVYEIPEKENSKLTLSNLSRLIPSDFYGNRVSVKPESLFKPWKQQYQKYNQNSNDALKKYHTSLEYKYEVTLDLENFFPTINPVIIYHYIIGYLPAHLSEQDMSLMKTVLRKLLFCELDFGKSDTTIFTEQLQEQYLKISKHKTLKSKDDEQQNTINTEKTKDAEPPETAVKSRKFVRGIPQGLPQSYFLGNIYMIIVSEIFRNTFTGVSYFYVDDSVIFTNDIQEDKFRKQLENINEQITKKEQDFLKKYQKENTEIYPQNTQEFYESNLYGVGLHLSGKSSYVRLDRLDESEVYLKCISRQMSQAGSDFFRMYSDEENRNLEKKFEILCQQVKAQLDKLEKQSQEKEKQNLPEPEVRDTKKFKDRLIRYYRFFKYRKQRLSAMHRPEDDSDEQIYKEELEEIIYAGVQDKTLERFIDGRVQSAKEKKDILERFMKSYSNDIWDAAVGMYQTFAEEEEISKLRRYVQEIDKLCFEKGGEKFSYLQCTYRELLGNNVDMTEEELHILYDDSYKSLKRLAQIKLKKYANKHYEVAEYYCARFQKQQDEEIVKILFSEEKGLYDKMKQVRANTQKILRMVMNTIYSYLFNVEISDHPVLAKNSKKALTYGELRILAFLRNPWFQTEEFRKREIVLKDPLNKGVVDYSIMRVMEIFYSFVKDPVKIDNLILTHKYVYDVWQNGSKHLYFYTLHNQEHAITLIQNIVKLIHTIDFFKISAIDYYILFLACYLHDISMVKIPSSDLFLIDTDKADELAKDLQDEYKQENLPENGPDILCIKKYMLDSYKKIDGYFEEIVRGRHEKDSAAEIRKRSDISYLDVLIREVVAEVSEAHGVDERDIYGRKSVASQQLLSIKFDKILIRLADLLDMSNYRVSKPILHHNMQQMSETSAFHWISHLLTQGYKLYTEYEINNKEGGLIPKTITEKLILEIPVAMSQMSAFACKKPCEKVKIDRTRISQHQIILICGEKCEENNEDNEKERNCNFLCQWFNVKNDYLIRELAALKEYLRRNVNNYFECEIEIRITCTEKTNIDAKQFEVLNNYINKKKHI